MSIKRLYSSFLNAKPFITHTVKNSSLIKTVFLSCKLLLLVFKTVYLISLWTYLDNNVEQNQTLLSIITTILIYS